MSTGDEAVKAKEILQIAPLNSSILEAQEARIREITALCDSWKAKLDTETGLRFASEGRVAQMRETIEQHNCYDTPPDRIPCDCPAEILKAVNSPTPSDLSKNG